MSARAERTVRAAGRAVPVSNPDKEMFPEDGITKAELVDHYLSVSRVMLPFLRDRPLVMERYPDGRGGRSFFHKDMPDHFPDWIRHLDVPKKGGTVDMVVCDDAATLAYLAAQACLTPHPFLSRTDRLDCPDRLVFDLDPSSEGDFATVRWAAGRLRELLGDLGLRPAVMTTGSRGLHLVVPLKDRTGFDSARAFARRTADLLAARHPDRLTTAARKADRGGRLYLDVQRNTYAQTSVAPFAVRARPHAPVATPLHWDELDDPALGPRRWTLRTLPQRLAEAGNPWKGLGRSRRSLSAAGRRLDALVADERDG